MPKKRPDRTPPVPKLPRRVPIETFAVAKQVTLYGEQGAHSESREPPQHDDVFPERFFGGPLYANQPIRYPFIAQKAFKK